MTNLRIDKALYLAILMTKGKIFTATGKTRLEAHLKAVIESLS